MTTVVVLGASGMLGSMVVDVLAAQPGLEVAGTVRSAALAAACHGKLPEVEWRRYDAAVRGASLDRAIDGAQWIVNAIGLTKPYIHDDDPAEIERAIRVNSAFPFDLAHAADRVGAEVIQIATDCVFSGASGRYTEKSPHDALDVYGKTKSLGEPPLDNVHLLRSSIIGPEPGAQTFLLEWVRRQPPNATVNGFVDHLWNGVTTHAFARLAAGIIRSGSAPRLQHVIPERDVTKADLLVMIAEAYGRRDLTVNRVNAPSAVDRTLRTAQVEANDALWRAAGYEAPPSIATMVSDVAQHPTRLSGIDA